MFFYYTALTSRLECKSASMVMSWIIQTKNMVKFWIIQTKNGQRSESFRITGDNRQADMFCQVAHANLHQISVSRSKRSDNCCMFSTNLSVQKQKLSGVSTNELEGEQLEPRRLQAVPLAPICLFFSENAVLVGRYMLLRS